MFINTFSNIYFRDGQFEFAPVFSEVRGLGWGHGVWRHLFNHISAISYRIVLLVNETGVLGQNHQSAPSHRKWGSCQSIFSVQYFVDHHLSFWHFSFWWGSCYSIFSCMCMFCRSLLVLLYFFVSVFVSSVLRQFSLPLWYLHTLILAKDTIAIGSWENLRHRLSELTNLIIQGFIEFTSLGWKCDFNKAFWR